MNNYSLFLHLIFLIYITIENDVTKTSSSFDNSQQVSQQNHEQQIKQQISELVDFETEIANITKSQAQRRQDSKTYKNTSLIKLNDKADFLDWKQYFNKAFDHHLNRKLDEEYQDVTYAEEYIGNLRIQKMINKGSVSKITEIFNKNYITVYKFSL